MNLLDMSSDELLNHISTGDNINKFADELKAHPRSLLCAIAEILLKRGDLQPDEYDFLTSI